jgi:hypothetical protein
MGKARKATVTVPTPAKFDSRICFAIAYFTSEADAAVYAAMVRKRGDTYNGGYFHGMPCGRDTGWDHVDPALGPLFAVTT